VFAAIPQDIEGTAVNLSVLHLGIRVFHQLTCASTFSWAKVRKLSFKRKKFLIKLHPESYVCVWAATRAHIPHS
jgi:FERM/RhoGEF/pleckstrin domain protein 2